MTAQSFYQPADQGLEIKIAERLRRLEQRDQSSGAKRRS
jgi:hypothetical protein